jgi:hypothetical protein
MKIHLHIGVHKTATTYIQSRLNASVFKLNKAGIGYFPLWDFRTSAWRDVMKIEPNGFRLEDHLHSFFPKFRPAHVEGLIISDENLIGLCGSFVKSGRLFHGARQRLAHLRRLFAGHEVSLFCAVRSYDTFLSSAYCEALRTNTRYISFDDFRNSLKWTSVNWTRVLAGFEAGLEPNHIHLWKYEDFEEKSEQIFRTLAFGEPPVAKAVDDAPVYKSFSHTAVDAIDSVAKQLGPVIAAKLARPIGDALKKTDGYPAFQPWNETDKLRLEKQYLEDCARIPAGKWLGSGQPRRGTRSGHQRKKRMEHAHGRW